MAVFPDCHTVYNLRSIYVPLLLGYLLYAQRRALPTPVAFRGIRTGVSFLGNSPEGSNNRRIYRSKNEKKKKVLCVCMQTGVKTSELRD